MKTISKNTVSFILFTILLLALGFMLGQISMQNQRQMDIIRSLVISDLQSEYGTNILILNTQNRIEFSFTYGKHKEVYIFTEKDYHKLYEP